MLSSGERADSSHSLPSQSWLLLQFFIIRDGFSCSSS
jgi:hypothetical protein